MRDRTFGGLVAVAALVLFGLNVQRAALGQADVAAPGGVGASCLGDCSQDGHVTIDELILGVGIALGDGDIASCTALDRNDNAQIEIDELLGAVGNSLNGCRQMTVISARVDIADSVGIYRNLLGPDNGGEPGRHAGGRREINWDAVPDSDAAPNFLPGDYFNAATAPRARGVNLSTPGTGVQVSADSDNPTQTPVRFGHINPSYPNQFVTFSAERLFSPIGSNVVYLTFFVPGTNTPAVVRGFGAVYTDVDQGGSEFEYFDKDGRSLGIFPVLPANNGLSFLGVVFDAPVVALVQIHYGNSALGPEESGDVDVSVMDDFIFGEPQPAN
jgi:hypothetical protein